MRQRIFTATAAIVAVLLGCDSGTGPDGVVAITADPPEIFMIVGANAPIRVLGRRSDGSTVQLPAASARFTSANSIVARLAHDSAGLVIAGQVGETTVNVSVPAGSRTLTSTVRVVVGNLVGVRHRFVAGVRYDGALAVPNDSNLPAVLEDRTRRALRQPPRTNVFAERHEQPIDLDPVLLRQRLLEREHRRFRHRGRDVAPGV